MFPASDYLNFAHCKHASLFAANEPVWNALAKIAPYLREHLEPQNLAEMRGSSYIGPNVRIGKGTIVMPHVTILGPAWIGDDCFIAPGCYIRENTIFGDGVIAGNACEFKNCVLFDKVEVPHWNYVGDSILGYKAHLGAGVILSNYRLDHGKVPVLDPKNPGSKIDTGLDKFGAIVGDHVDIGSNAVISPGSLLGRNSMIYPGAHFCGVLPDNTILKVRQAQQLVERRPI